MFLSNGGGGQKLPQTNCLSLIGFGSTSSPINYTRIGQRLPATQGEKKELERRKVDGYFDCIRMQRDRKLQHKLLQHIQT